MRGAEISLPVLILVGPTAVGKTEFSLNLADSFNGEIVSVDSMQVYRYMDIGTAKVEKAERSRIQHHLIDIVDPDQDYNAAQFAQDCRQAISEIQSRNALPILAGGSGLYFKAFREGLFPGCQRNEKIRQRLTILQEKHGHDYLHKMLSRLDPVTAQRLHINDSYRVIRALEILLDTGMQFSVHLDQSAAKTDTSRFSNVISIGLTCPREQLYKRINQRTSAMIAGGLADEVRFLLEKGYSAELKSMQAIGYRHMINYLSGVWSKAEMQELLARDTRRYAKRQYTWFNRDKSIRWYEYTELNKVFQLVSDWLNKSSL